MKTNKPSRYFLFALALFLWSCNNPFEPPAIKSKSGGMPEMEEGMGQLVLGINSNAHTILPAMPDDEDFIKYDLLFNADELVDINLSRTAAEIATPIPLPPGTWALAITAYISDGSGGYLPVAMGSLSGIGISAGNTTSRSLILEATMEEGEGSFTYTISYPVGATAAAMAITPLSTGGTDAQTLDFITGGNSTSGTLTLNAGFYRVASSITCSGRTRGRNEILHIYKNLVSTVNYTFTPEYFDNKLYVTSGADSGLGTLRDALTIAAAGETIYFKLDGDKTITLTSGLPTITKNLII
jgi:hypothetical protein